MSAGEVEDEPPSLGSNILEKMRKDSIERRSSIESNLTNKTTQSPKTSAPTNLGLFKVLVFFLAQKKSKKLLVYIVMKIIVGPPFQRFFSLFSVSTLRSLGGR